MTKQDKLDAIKSMMDVCNNHKEFWSVILMYKEDPNYSEITMKDIEQHCGLKTTKDCQIVRC